MPSDKKAEERTKVKNLVHEIQTELTKSCIRLEMITSILKEHQYSKSFNLAEKELTGMKIVLSYLVGEYDEKILGSTTDLREFAPRNAFEIGEQVHKYFKIGNRGSD